MDFVKKILHQISRKSEAVSQITFDEDYNEIGRASCRERV